MGLIAVVISEAWHLYHEPARIAVFAAQVESASGVDQMFNNLVSDSSPAQPDARDDTVRPSYYLSWILVLLLLSLLTRVAFGCIREGGRILSGTLRNIAEPAKTGSRRAAEETAKKSAPQEQAEPKTVVPRFRAATQLPRPAERVGRLRERSAN